MIYDLDKIDFSRHNKLKKIIYMTIYDTLIKNMDPRKHKYYLDKKIELYVNYILSNGMSRFYSISDTKEKKYQYIIQLVLDFIPDQQYIHYIKIVDSQVGDDTAGRVHVII